MSREVLSPPQMRMGSNRCYRVNLIHEDFSSQCGTAMGSQNQSVTTNKAYAEDGK